MSFLETWWNQGTWAHRLDFNARWGWQVRPADILKVDGFSHCVRAIDLRLKGRGEWIDIPKPKAANAA